MHSGHLPPPDPWRLQEHFLRCFSLGHLCSGPKALSKDWYEDFLILKISWPERFLDLEYQSSFQFLSMVCSPNFLFLWTCSHIGVTSNSFVQLLAYQNQILSLETMPFLLFETFWQHWGFLFHSIVSPFWLDLKLEHAVGAVQQLFKRCPLLSVASWELVVVMFKLILKDCEKYYVSSKGWLWTWLCVLIGVDMTCGG